MPRFTGRNSTATNYTLRAQSVAPTLTYSIAPLSAFDWYVDDVIAAEIRAQLQSLTGVTFSEADATEQVKLAQVLAPAAASATGVHAAVAGNAASNSFPGPITNPAVPRNVTAVAAAAWDGGDIVVTGTDQYGATQTETITPVGGTTVAGVKIFKTVTSISKTFVGAAADACSVGTGNKLGLGWNMLVGVLLLVDGALDATAVFDAANDAVQPSAGVVPNGARNYKALCSG